MAIGTPGGLRGRGQKKVSPKCPEKPLNKLSLSTKNVMLRERRDRKIFIIDEPGGRQSEALPALSLTEPCKIFPSIPKLARCIAISHCYLYNIDKVPVDRDGKFCYGRRILTERIVIHIGFPSRQSPAYTILMFYP
jgi:hypothetical protein